MAQGSISARTYFIVCGILILLTILTVSVSFLPLRGLWHVVIGLLIAGCKATLVVLFFMHALISPRLIWAVIIVSCFWLGLLLVLSLGDYLTRGMVPYTPGH